MALLDNLARNRPRETSGSRSANRLNYQKDWALCRLLKLHASGQDYLIVFDYHDDVVILNNSANPTSVSFYQIKTKTSGNWTAAALSKRKKGKDGLLNSHLGKLYSNKLMEKDGTEGLHFVSNARFSILLADDTNSIEKDMICLAGATKSELKKIMEALRDEHSLAATPQDEGIIYLEVTPLSVQGHSAHAQGYVVQFIEALPDSTIPAQALYRTILAEITRRTTEESLSTTAEELRKKKALSRQQFQLMLESIPSRHTHEDTVNMIRTQLQAESVPFQRISDIVRLARRFLTQQLDASDSVLQAAWEEATMTLTLMRASDSSPERLDECINFVMGKRLSNLERVVAIHSRGYAEAIIAVAAYYETR